MGIGKCTKIFSGAPYHTIQPSGFSVSVSQLLTGLWMDEETFVELNNFDEPDFSFSVNSNDLDNPISCHVVPPATDRFCL